MSKIKLTKGELKKQRDSLKQFTRYLPTLQLKKQQLQSTILEAREELKKHVQGLTEQEQEIWNWVGLLADSKVDIEKWICPLRVDTEIVNIAGANVPVLKDVHFENPDYDLYETPFWIDRGIKEIKDFMSKYVQVLILERKVELLEHELRVTTQRVNLFEKIKIPECQDNIRRIRIYLGDLQANAVGIGKVAKKKVEAKANEEELLVSL